MIAFVMGCLAGIAASMIVVMVALSWWDAKIAREYSEYFGEDDDCIEEDGDE